jgi:hypothetical protein
MKRGGEIVWRTPPPVVQFGQLTPAPVDDF